MIPAGYCQCGCGGKTWVATYSSAKAGYVRGEPVRFCRGHGRALSTTFYVEDRQTGCWVWQRFKDSQGYGWIKRGGKRHPAHRLMYEQVHGPVPDGLEIDHLCRNESCVNPEHLEAVTHTQNMRRSSNTKLSIEDVVAIKVSHERARVLAARYRVCEATIYNVRKRPVPA